MRYHSQSHRVVCSQERHMADALTVWELSEAVTVRFDVGGCVQLSKGGKDRYLIQQAEPSAVAERLEQLMTETEDYR